MAQYGIALGIVLLIVVTATALALASKATASVRQFREEHHEHFLGRKEP